MGVTRANLVALFGYLASSLLAFQVAAVIFVAILQFFIFNHITIKKSSTTNDVVGTALTPYVDAVEATKPTESNVVFIAGLWIVFVVIAGVLAYCTSKAAANIVRTLLERYFGRVTIKKLFTAKIVVPTVSFGAIALSSLLLPATTYIVPLNAILLVLCLLCFGVQYILVWRYKIPVKKVL